MKFLIKFLWLFLPRMPAYAGAQSGITPSLSDDNWAMDASSAGDVAKILGIGWGGELTTSTGYHTRWVRPTTSGVGALTPITPEDHHPAYSTPFVEFGAGWGTTPPVLPSEPIALHNQNWNAHGGLGYVVLPLANPWLLINGLLNDQLCCRNLSGIDANGSSYTVTWEE